jgi:hypothetical protein
MGGDLLGGAGVLLGTGNDAVGGLHVLRDLVLDGVDEIGSLRRADHDVIDLATDLVDEAAALVGLTAPRQARQNHRRRRRDYRQP